MTDQAGRKSTTAAVADPVRAWFNEHGWQLEPAELRAALAERAADDDTIIELLDEGAERRRAQPPAPKPEPAVPQRTRPTQQPPELRAVTDSGQVPPQNLEAEESVLGAMMISPGAITACMDILDASGREFYRESHAIVWRASLQLHANGSPVDAITLTDQLERAGLLEQAGGRVRLHELAALVPASANAGHYAKIVAGTARLRGLIRAGGEVSRLGWDGTGEIDELLEQAARIIDSATAAPLQIQVRDRLVPGGAFILDADSDTASLWGTDGDAIAWASGEGLMVAGPQGVGKTTVMQQIALARCGVRTAVLGMPVVPDDRKVLYIAADRPRQAQRSLARMVDERDRAQLDEKLIVHRGPPMPLITTDDRSLARLAEQAGAGTVIVDSLKDVGTKLADDDHGGRINLAFQALIADGVELVVGHHQRKASGDNKKPSKLDDVYGSTWITSGLGSVLLLWGEPGDVLIELTHLKQPREEIGPWNLHHDHIKGLTSVAAKPDLVTLAHRAGTAGLTAIQASELLYEKTDVSRNDVEKTRSKLERLAESGKLAKVPGVRGNEPARYFFNGGTQEGL